VSSDAQRERQRRWRSANADRERERLRRFRIANPEKRIKDQQRRRAIITSRLDAIKLERGCVDCGFNGHPVALEFDHLPGSGKVANISHMRGGSWAAVEAEIAKCEVVCSNCHRIRTTERGWNSERRQTSIVALPSLFDEEAS
jgi:hypothetical protein